MNQPRHSKSTRRWQKPLNSSDEYTLPDAGLSSPPTPTATPRPESSHPLPIDVVDIYLAEELIDTPLDVAATAFLGRLQKHPCRKCPHLLLQRAAGIVDAVPGTLPAMKRPGCRIMPYWAPDERGRLVAVFRETWEACPLHGVTNIRERLESLAARIEALERQAGFPETPMRARRGGDRIGADGDRTEEL